LGQIIPSLQKGTGFTYYRTQAAAEIDLILETSSAEVIAIEVKRTLSPKLSRIFSGSARENSTEVACDATVVEGLADDGAVKAGHGIQAVQVFRAGDSAAGDEVAVQE